MKEEKVRALCKLANIHIVDLQKIPNRYWPPHPEYNEIREQLPWWKIVTKKGSIIIGKRSSCIIHIEWDAALIKDRLYYYSTSKQTDHYIHATDYYNALKYLTKLNEKLMTIN